MGLLDNASCVVICCNVLLTAPAQSTSTLVGPSLNPFEFRSTVLSLGYYNPATAFGVLNLYSHEVSRYVPEREDDGDNMSLGQSGRGFAIILLRIVYVPPVLLLALLFVLYVAC